MASGEDTRGGGRKKEAKEYKTRKDLDNSFDYDYCNGVQMVQR